jgi:predicted RNA-binding protein YlxR (DUF448 family)
MENKKVPLRQCIVCRESKPKKELIRIVRTVENDFAIDKTGKLNGRGSYICNSEDCINKLVKQRALNKAFKTNVSQEVYDKLKEQFVENR